MNTEATQLSSLLDHTDLKTVWKEMSGLMVEGYGKSVLKSLEKAYLQTIKAFQGKMKGYQACNTEYHTLGHSIDVFVGTVRLIDGFRLSGFNLSPDQATELAIAALLHDIGYLLETGDVGGTGAKYTKIHVRRGVEFLEQHHKAFGLSEARVPSVSRLIYGTDLALAWNSIGFVGAPEQTCAAILATADLLGQMSDRAYLEKLLFLFYEFREAGFDNYQTAFDVLRSTQGFYKAMKLRMDTSLEKAYDKAVPHFQKRFGVTENLYITSIERQLDYLKSIMDDTSTNFRKKLKRLDLEMFEEQRRA